MRNGQRALVELLLEQPRRKEQKRRLDRLRADFSKSEAGKLEASEAIRDILISPVLKRVLCNPTNFSFNPNSIILARINRVELGEFDALVLGLFVIAQLEGQIVVPDFGFYGRNAHVSLVRENRLIASVNFLAEVPPKLRHSVLLIKDKVPSV